MLSYEFVILEVNGASCEFTLDDIYWEVGGTVDVINENKDLILQEFILYNNYPNPFNPSTNIRYDLPEATNVTISIYDMMGREIKKLINTNQNSGYKSVIWNGTNDNGEIVSVGMYFYSIKTNTFNQTRKMILLK